MGRGGLSVAEFLPHNSAFQSENWPIFENHAMKDPAHSGILRARGGSSHLIVSRESMARYSPRTRR